jgi:methylmalonyl-CoA mutase N-terminal domain/subunit
VTADQLRGTGAERHAGEYIARHVDFPPEPSIRLTGDIVEFCARNVPKFNPISVSGTHIAECGANSIQVIAYPMLNALCYIDEVLRRGLSIDEFAPQITFHLPAGGLENYSLWESIAKFRAGAASGPVCCRNAGAKDPKSLRMKFSTGWAAAGSRQRSRSTTSRGSRTTR